MSRNACVDLLLILLAIFLPFLAVGIRRGFCTADFIINVALCVLGYFPGMIHALYIIAKTPSRNADREPLLPN